MVQKSGEGGGLTYYTFSLFYKNISFSYHIKWWIDCSTSSKHYFSSTIDKNYIEIGQLRQWFFDCHRKRIRTKNLVSVAATMHLIVFEIQKLSLMCKPQTRSGFLIITWQHPPSPPNRKDSYLTCWAPVDLSPGNLHQYPPPYKMCMCHITGIQNLVLPWRPPQVIQTELSNDCTSNYPHIWTKQVILSRQESNNFLLLAIQEMTFTMSKYSVVIARFSSNLHHKLFSFIFFSMFKLLVQKIIENCRHYPFK